MSSRPRQMRLTPKHVAKVFREYPDDDRPPDGVTRSNEEDHRATLTHLLGSEPNKSDIWFFAYGSLIWKPACEFVEMRSGLLRGWHRSFCLGWNTRFRGSEENPGLMLALDRGGACNGVLYRLPPDDVEANLTRLLEREMAFKPSPFPPRWVNVTTPERTIRALTFIIDRNSSLYVSGLTDDQIAHMLATAVGPRGSMAEYLLATVDHLERMGIRDAYLWRLQAMVADRIDATHGSEPA